MRSLLRIYRMFAIIALYFFCAALTLPYRVKGIYGLKKITKISSLWMRLVSKVMNINISVKEDPGDSTNGLIVSNHLSYIDILVHGSIFNIRFAPKSDIAHWFIIG